MDNDIGWICWHVRKCGIAESSHNRESYEKPLDVGAFPGLSDKAKRLRDFSYQPIHVASFFDHTLCVGKQFWCLKEWHLMLQ